MVRGAGVPLTAGGAGGIGGATAVRFVSAGASVVIADADAEVSGVTAVALGVHSVPTDVGDPAAVERLFAFIDAQFGRLHVLVNNAGISAAKPVEQLDVAGWDRVLAVNLR